jgi:acyl-CoA dehydrogenase
VCWRTKAASALPSGHQDIRDAVRALCRQFPDEYFRKDRRAARYPEAFVDALTAAGWLAAMIPEEYGGSGLGLTAASVIMEEINRSGGNAGAVHGQMYNMGTLLRHGSRRAEGKIPAGDRRRQTAPAVDGGDRADHRHRHHQASRPPPSGQGDRYVVNGQKVWISRVQHSDLMILLARTTPLAEVKRKIRRHVDLHRRPARGDRPRPDGAADRQHGQPRDQRTVLRQPRDPAENLIGEEGQGFRYILDGLNAERTLIAAECIGDGYWFIERATPLRQGAHRLRPADRQNQGVQFPIAEAFIEIEAANLMRFKACALFDAQQPCGAEANMAKYLAAKASWEAANVCLQTHGGFGFANEYDIERKFRETRLYQVAPISTNLIFSYVAEHLLGLPRSF